MELFRVPTHQGLILDGSMPSWLLTALVRLYIDRDAASETDKQTDDGGHTGERLPWIACYQPSLRGAVIVFSRTSEYPVSTCVALHARN
jgi:CRISPR-associated protein (Cas_csx3)